MNFAETAENGRLWKLRSVLQISFLRRKTSFATPQFRPPSRMKLERLTFLRSGLVPFPVYEFRGNSRKWAVVETEVSPSNFIFAAKNIVCYPPVPPAVKNEIGTTDLPTLGAGAVSSS
jgi:hypothetical protein